MNKDYIYRTSDQPFIDNIIDFYNPRRVEPFTVRYIGVAFNGSQLHTAVAGVMFINFCTTFFNNEGGNRNLTFFDVAVVLTNTVTATAQTVYLGLFFPVFSYIRLTAAGGNVANAATVITFTGLRLII